MPTASRTRLQGGAGAGGMGVSERAHCGSSAPGSQRLRLAGRQPSSSSGASSHVWKTQMAAGCVASTMTDAIHIFLEASTRAVKTEVRASV